VYAGATGGGRDSSPPRERARVEPIRPQAPASSRHAAPGSVVSVTGRPLPPFASVRFSGAIREHTERPAEPFVQVWNLVKPRSGRDGWLLAGIQQMGEG
jgi:hypothetical protein